jgi:hypothetical protein
MAQMTRTGALAASVLVVLAVAVSGCSGHSTPAATGHKKLAAAHQSASGSAGYLTTNMPGVKYDKASRTYLVDCSVAQCTEQAGAGPSGSTCLLPSTGMQICSLRFQAEQTPAPAATPSLIPLCQMGYVNIPAGSGVDVSQKTFQLSAPVPDTADGYDLADYEAMRIKLTAIGGDIQVNEVTVIFYTSSGQEISSGTANVGELIAADQTLTFLYDESEGSSLNPPAGAATCQVVSYQ